MMILYLLNISEISSLLNNNKIQKTNDIVKNRICHEYKLSGDDTGFFKLNLQNKSFKNGKA